MFFTRFFKTQNIVQTMHLTMLIAHPYPLRQNAGWTPKILTWGFPKFKKISQELQILFHVILNWGVTLNVVVNCQKCHTFHKKGFLCTYSIAWSYHNKLQNKPFFEKMFWSKLEMTAVLKCQKKLCTQNFLWHWKWMNDLESGLGGQKCFDQSEWNIKD